MNLIKYSLNIPSENEDIVAAGLYDCGVEGVEIEDSIPLSDDELKNMFVDIPKSVQDNGRAVLSFYLDSDDENTEDILMQVDEELDSLIERGLIESKALTEEDISRVNWQDNWKKYFKAFNIDNIYIVPAWENCADYEADDRIIIRVDPGTAFGTGKHETTQLCVKELIKTVKDGTSILDIGTGSGILGIIALKLGAAKVNAIDIDENVVNAVEENLFNNNVNRSDFELEIGDISNNEALMSRLLLNKYDIITANILPNVLAVITKYVRKLMNKDTVYILSGILETKADEVRGFLKENEMEVISSSQMGEWVAITAKLK